MRSVHFEVGVGRPLEHLAKGAAQWAAERGYNRPDRGYGAIIAHPAMTRQLADAYNALPSYHRDSIPAFKAMAAETEQQFDYVTRSRKQGGLGVHVEVTQHDPYPNIADMWRDMHEHNRMRVLSTSQTGGHPIFTDEQNDKFRAVHDVFGHLATGRGVDRHGEEAAYRSHAGMYSPLARGALATETRGQNSAMIAAGGVFQEQKMAALPARYADVRPVVGRRSAERMNAILQARQFHAAQFGQQ